MKKTVLYLMFAVSALLLSCEEKKTESTNTSFKSETSKVSQEDTQTSVSAEALQIDEPSIVVNEKTLPSKNNVNLVVDKESEKIRASHKKFLENSPFKKTLAMSKTERKAIGLPPNKFYEQEWELTINPVTGKPDFDKLATLRRQLADERANDLANGRTPGDASDNNWVERGPNNVGGRVRAVMFDPNDPTYKTVFAGGVSGGLWKNTDITNASSQWTLVSLPDNLAVSAITYDPNNTTTFYVGTGESYVGGDVNGDGLWKSTDGGNTWTNVFGGITGPTTFESAANVVITAPGGIAGSYACYPTTAFGTPITAPIPGEIVLVSNTNPLGCNANPITNNVSGKIALIRRGTCTFVEKVKNAQTAGAIGVIMMNNVDGTPVAMGGTDATITIPSVMISKADGDILEAAALGGTVTGSLTSGPGTFTGNLVPGQQHINDVVVRNNGGVSEIFVAAGDSFYGAANSATYLGGPDFGLYKSINGGVSWTEINLPLTTNGYKYCPNDLEIGANNKLWMSTTSSVVYGDGGGAIFSSTDGTNFSLTYTVPGGDRTQIAPSMTNVDKVYVLVEDGASNEPNMYLTTNGFSSVSTLSEPASDGDISATDFCRGQAFYDLVIKVDPSNDNIAYIGGINIHRTTNSGSSWAKMSGWTTSVPPNVHSDQHGIAFHPNNSNVAVFGNDGGVYYSSNLSTAASSSTGVVARNNGLNITQFYSVGVAPTNIVSGLTNEYFAAGAQDNGTQYFAGVTGGINGSTQSQGGDGAFTLMDQGSDKYYISNYVYNENINYRLMVSPFTTRTIDNDNGGNNGAFIAPMALDSNQDVLFSDYSNGTTYQIRRYRNIKSGIVNRANLTNALLTASPTALIVSPFTTSSTTLFVGTRLGKLLKITNASVTPVWTEITGPSFVGSISDVEFGQSENEIFVTMHNYNVVSIWYTNNGGATWLNKEGDFPDIPVKAILQNPLNLEEVIIGTELGVWYTNNFSSSSPNWHQSYNGMSNVKVMDLDLRNDNVVFAATYGRGLFSGLFTSTILLSEDTHDNTKGIVVYPNPVSDNLNISYKEALGNVTIEFFDLLGKQVLSTNKELINSNSSIDVSSLQTGTYIIKVKGENYNYIQQIIKK